MLLKDEMRKGEGGKEIDGNWKKNGGRTEGRKLDKREV